MEILNSIKHIGVGVVLMVLAATANASLIITLTHDGTNGVIASFSGSGQTSGDDNGSSLWFSDGVGGLTSTSIFGAALIPNLDFNASLDIVALDILTNQDGIFSMILDGGTGGPGTAFDISGSAVVNGAAFSDLNVGTYGPTGATLTNEIGDFTLIIQDVQVPEPTTLALLGLGIAGVGWSRRKRA